MKTYKSSDLTNNKRAEVFREAEANGVIIQQCRTNGEVIIEFVMLPVIVSDHIDRSIEVGNTIYHVDDINGF